MIRTGCKIVVLLMLAVVVNGCYYRQAEPFPGAEDLRKLQYRAGWREGFAKLSPEQKVEFLIYGSESRHPPDTSAGELFEHEPLSTFNALVDRLLKPDVYEYTVMDGISVLETADVEILKQLRDSGRLDALEERVQEIRSANCRRLCQNYLRHVKSELRYADAECKPRE